MNKIFPKIYLKFDLKCFHSIVFSSIIVLSLNKLILISITLLHLVFLVIHILIPM